MATLTREIAYEPLPSQRKFHECGTRYKLFSGAVGSGKSAALVQEAIRLSVINHGLLGLIGAPTYRVLHDTTERAFFEVLNTNRIPYVYNKSDKECLLTDLGSRIIFRTLDDPTRLVGTNLAWFAIDETAYTNEASFLRLQARLREPKARQLCGVGATTPAGLNWVYDRFLGDKKNDQFEMIQAVPGENHYLPGDFYQTLAKSYDPRFYEQEVLGRYISLTSGTAYHAFSRDRNVKQNIVYNSQSKLIWALDFNVDPMTSVIGQINDYSPAAHLSTAQHRQLEILEEIVIRDGNIDLVCRTFQERVQKYRKRAQRIQVHLYGDSAGNARSHAGPTDYSLIKQFFARVSEVELVFHVQSANPAVKDRVNAVNALLLNAAGESRLFIDSHCKALITDMERVVFARDSNGNLLDALSKKEKLLSHVSDATGYCVNQEFPLDRTSAGFKSTRII